MCTHFEDVLSRSRAHLLIYHEDDDTFVIQTSTSSTTAHLNVLSRGDLLESENPVVVRIQVKDQIDGFAHHCSNSSALAMELL